MGGLGKARHGKARKGGELESLNMAELTFPLLLQEMPRHCPKTHSGLPGCRLGHRAETNPSRGLNSEEGRILELAERCGEINATTISMPASLIRQHLRLARCREWSISVISHFTGPR